MQLDFLLRRSRPIKTLGAVCAVALALQSAELGAQHRLDDSLGAHIKRLDKSSRWTLLSQTPLQFNSHHPQGMVKIGEVFFLSSVETIDAPVRLREPATPFDRTTGSGVGHLFKISASGSLLGHITLGEGAMYHPGGIDFDGESLWVSVAQYRPNSHSIVYKVDPDTLAATEIFRFADHLGAIARDSAQDKLHGISWGSRKIVSWQGEEANYSNVPATTTLNPSHYIDYQDCQSLSENKMLCSGLSSYRDATGAAFKLGGIDLIDLNVMRPEFQLPVTQTTAGGALLTQNPFYAELIENGDLVFYFVPEDEQSFLYTYTLR